MEFQKVSRPAPLKNVTAFAIMLETVVEREPGLPGMACFFGPSGFGKTRAAVYAANKYRALYVECDQFTTAKSLLTMILQELGVREPRGAVTDLISETIKLMAAHPDRPLIVDEAHYVAHKRFINLLRTLHDKSQAAIVLIGEEILPKSLERYERVYTCMLVWQAASPCDREDFNELVKSYCPNVKVSDDLARAILVKTAGNARRITVTLAAAKSVAATTGAEHLTLDQFPISQIFTGASPDPRVVRFA